MSHPLMAALVGATTTTLVRRALAWTGDSGRWSRTNHRGEPISLMQGPAVSAGLIAGTMVGRDPSRDRAASVIATTAGAVFGLIDDLAEDTTVRTKGLRGHLGALSRGQLTTGGLKVVGIGAASLVASVVLAGRSHGWRARGADIAINTALIAGTANLVNLVDLRPGRALKASAALSMAPGPVGAAAAVLGSCLAAAPGDLSERDMLGDCGANALGAHLGTRMAAGLPRGIRGLVLVAVVGLTVASERVSFSAVIDKTSWLARIDRWGRRPYSPADVDSVA